MVNKYKIRDNKGEYDHYEYLIDHLPIKIDVETSPSTFGIALVEEYASRILGTRVCFFHFNESRFFPFNTTRTKDSMTLDISLLKIGLENYSIIAETTYAGEVLMEIAGKITVI